MLKYKSLIITVVLALGLMTGGIAGAARLSQSKSEEFAGDGYVLAVAETEGGLEADPIYFTGGTHYQSSYPDNAVFKDVRGTKYEVGKDSFLMYADGSVSSLSSGVVVNLDDVNGGLVNHYALSSGTVMASSGNTYTVDSNGTPLTFSSFLWKVSDSRYLIYSDNLAVQTFGGNNGDFSGMVQIDYLEDGVIRLTSETAVWQGVAAGATATTSDGVTLSFADKTLLDSDGAARMTLGEILLDADGNIHVQSALDWVPPIFEFEVIDGENGVNGIAGEDGEAGEAGSQGEAGMQGDEGEEGEAGSDGAAGEEGEEGEEGEAGEDGEAGANGSNGNDGENGSNGKTGTIPQNDSQTQATFTLTSFNVDGGSVSGTISVIDDDGVLSEPGSIYLVNVSTGAIIEVLVDGDTVESFADGDELSFEADNLSPDTQYRLIVKSAYILNSTEGEKDYINRTFYTDTSGVFLELDYATTSGFYATLTTKDYATATVATISILNSSGEEIYTTEAHLSAGEQEIEIDLTESGLTVSDVANREYEVRMKLSGGGNDEDETLTTQSWTTLKQTPTLGAATFNVNNSGYFEMGVEVVSDPDSAISYYNYTIYDDSGNAVKTVSNISDNSNVPLYIETGVIDTGEYYYAVATAYYYDNEKYVELSSTRSDSARIVDEGNSLVWFEHYGTATDEQGNLIETDTYYRYAELRGTLYIEKKNVSSIDTSKELTVLLESTSSADYSYSMQVSFGTYDTNETTLSVPVDYKGLKSDTTYRIAVWGWVTTTVDGGDTQETYTLLGNYALTTEAYPETVQIALVDYPDSDDLIAVSIELTTLSSVAAETAEETVGMFSAVQVSLYNGSSSSDDLIDSVVLVDSDSDYYSSDFSTYLDNTDGDNLWVVTNSANFGIANSSLTKNQYYIEVSAVYDYTYSYTYSNSENLTLYVNEIPFTSVGKVVQVDNDLPKLPDTTDAVKVTAITYGDLDKSIYSIIDPVDELEEDTIVGVILEAQYDNEMKYGRVLYYYGFLASTYNSFTVGDYSDPADAGRYTFAYPVEFTNSNSAPPLYVFFLDHTADVDGSVSAVTSGSTERDSDDWAIMKGVQTDGTMPYETTINGCTAIFVGRQNLTSSYESLGRGYHYIFGYKARLKVDSTTMIYPDEYKLERVGGKGLLCSQVFAAPRQNTQARMYLNKLLSGGEKIEWKLMVGSGDDPDSAWDKTYSGADSSNYKDGNFTNGLRAVSNSSSYTLDVAEPVSEYGWYTLTVTTIKGSAGAIPTTLDYWIRMYQELYADDDDYDDDTSYDPGQDLAEHYFAKPSSDWDEDDIFDSSTDDYINVYASYPSASNVVTFYFESVDDTYLSRIAEVIVGVYAYDETSQSQEMVYRFDRTLPTLTKLDDGSYRRSASIDLTKIPEDIRQSKNLAFKTEIVYDSGDVGLHWLKGEDLSNVTLPNASGGTDKQDISYDTVEGVYAAYIANVGNYMNYYNTHNSTSGAYSKVTNANLSYIYYGGYSLSIDSDRTWDDTGVTVEMLNRFDGYASSTATVPEFSIPLYFNESGSEYLAEGVKEGDGFPVVFSPLETTVYPATSSTYDNNFIRITDPNGNQVTNISASSLSPSITGYSFTRGLTSLTLHFNTSSQDLVAEYDPSTGTVSSNKYFVLKIYQLAGSSSGVTDTDLASASLISTRYIQLSDSTDSYEITEDGLLSGYYYAFVFTAYVEDTSTGNLTYVEKQVLYASSDNGARFKNSTLSSVEVTELEASEITYASYDNKYLGISYALNLTSGYTIEYTLAQYQTGTSVATGKTYTNDQVMQMMGYTKDTDGSWYYMSGTNKVYWTISNPMSETIHLYSKASSLYLEPGYDYVLTVTAKDANGNIVNYVSESGETSKVLPTVTFTYPSYTSPIGYVNVTHGTSLVNVSWSIADSKRSIVDNTYVVAYRQVNSDGSYGAWTTTGTAYDATSANSGTYTIPDSALTNSYQAAIFAYVDLDYSGSYTTGLDTTEFANLVTAGTVENYLITSATKSGTDSWGGTIGQVWPEKSGSNVIVYFADCTNLNKITQVTYTVLNTSSGDFVHGDINTVVSATYGIFSYDSSTNRYFLTLPVNITSGSWAVQLEAVAGTTTVTLPNDGALQPNLYW